MRVVVVDEDAKVARQLRNYLLRLDLPEPTLFHSVGAALSHFRSDEAEFDLLLTELQFRDGDGICLLTELAELGLRHPIAFVSGEDVRIIRSAHQLATSLKLDVIGDFEKPVNFRAVRSLVREARLHIEHRSTRMRESVGSYCKVYSQDDLREAIERGDLLPLYQPKVEIATGNFHSVEALVRWQHPKDGLLSPDRFIHLAETGELADLMADEMLRNALLDLNRWRRCGLNLRVAINITRHNLSSPGFAERVTESVANAGVDPSSVVFEVTEQGVLDDPKPVIAAATRLRLKRFGLSIDDFGTGHSSLSQLCDLPFDELKIDRGFVRGAVSNSSRRTIFETSVLIGNRLGLSTVAEGIETVEEWELARELNCHLAQGFLVGAPMRSSEIPAWADDWIEYGMRRIA